MPGSTVSERVKMMWWRGTGRRGILVEEVLWMMGEPAKCMQGEVLS